MKKSPAAIAFQNQHFDATTCSVQRNGVKVERVLGYPMTDMELVGLAGAPTGSVVMLTEKRAWTLAEIPDGEAVPCGLLLTITNDTYLSEPNEAVLYLDGHIDITSVYVKLVMFRDVKVWKGIAGHMTSTIVDATGALPKAGKLRLLAAGGLLWEDRVPGVRWGGYAAWPKYGFNCMMPSPTRALVTHFAYYPANLASCVTVADVIQKSGGREFWHTAGEGNYMNFDLASGSYSLAKLEQFLESWGT